MKLPENRAQAKKLNEKKYFTGLVCENGHIEPRYTVNGRCLGCMRDITRDLKNKEKRSAKYKEKRKNNREEFLEKEKEHRERNREKLREYTKCYRDSNKESVTGNEQRYRKRNPQAPRIRANIRRSRQNKAGGYFTKYDLEALWNWQKGLCPGCDSNLTAKDYHVDHVIPIARGGSSWPWNLQILCPNCNLSKGSKHPDEWVKPKFRCESC